MFDDLVKKYKGLLSNTGNTLSSFVQQNPTPAGFMNQQFQKRVAQPIVRAARPIIQPIAQRAAQTPILPFAPKLTFQTAPTWKAPLTNITSRIPQPLKTAAPGLQIPEMATEMVNRYGRILQGKGGAGDIAYTALDILPFAGSVKSLRRSPYISASVKTPTETGSQLLSGLRTNVAAPPSGVGSSLKTLPSNFTNRGFIQNYITTLRQRMQTKIPELESFVKQVTGLSSESRIKKVSSLEGKIQRYLSKGENPANIADTLGTRITATTTQEAEFIAQKLNQTGRIVETQNFFQKPTNWGYKGMNLKVKLQDGSLAEVQIHTPQSLEAATKIHTLYEKWRDIPETTLTKKQFLQFEKDRQTSLQIARSIQEAGAAVGGELKKTKIVTPKIQGPAKITQTTVPSPISSPSIIPPGSKERGFVTTVKESPVTARDVANKIEGYYTPTANRDMIAQASYTVKTDYDTALKRVMNEPLTAETNTIGLELMRQSQNSGRFDEAAKIAETLAIKGTKSGQAVQAFSVWGRLTPEGMLKYAQKEMLSANEKLDILTKTFRKAFGKGRIEFSGDDAKVITGLMKKANSTTDEAQRSRLIQEVFEYVGKKLPWGVSDLVDEYRYNNMLSNPLTHLRNAWSNVLQTYVTRPATLVAEGKPIEAIKYEVGAIKALPDAIGKFIKTIEEGKSSLRIDADISGMQPIKPKRLGKIANLPSTGLEAMDQFFSTLIRGGEEFRGNTKTAQEIAEYFLFRSDLNRQGQGVLLNKIDDITRAVYGLRRVGLGWMIPFIRTPMNVAKQWIEYSPAGFATTIGSANPREQIAKAALGSVATLVGASLAMEGKTTWAAPTDEKQKKLFYDSGRKPYSIKMGNNWVPMQTFGVWAYALGIPAAVKYYNDDSRTALTDSDMDKLLKNMSALAGFWSNQTFVSGLGSFVSLVQGKEDYTFTKVAGYTAGQVIPMTGLLRFVSSIVDPVYRKPKTFTDQIKSGIPFMTKDLPFYETTLGLPAKRNETNYGVGGPLGVAPYSQGKVNQEYEEPYQLRTQQLQQNAVLNQQKKELEQEAKKGLAGVQAAEKEPASVSDLTNKFKVDLAKEKVRFSGELQRVGNIVIYKDGDSVRTIDTSFQPSRPKLTGNTELDKKLISKYNGQITSKVNDIVDLYKVGEMSPEDAEKAIREIKAKSIKAGKKFPKPSFRVPKIKFPKIKVAKIKKISVKKLKTKQYKLKKPKFTKVKLKAKLT